MSVSGLTPPGSATYDSGTMYVGDGTWDANENTFLLPNLQGLNYATTRYNGMGNRFKDLPGYYSMVVAHGVLAAMTFLFLVPIAIMVNRFYWRSYYWKLRIHIWAQILTVLLTTVVFVLGFFQVGPRRSLTNPHHGIGVALYVLVLVQFIGGYLNYKVSKKRPHERRLLRVVLHQWMGRIIGLLGIVQVALGLTLYGSPLSLFVLYALAVFALVLAYFIFDFLNTTNSTYRPDAQSSYVSGPTGPPPEKHNTRGGWLKWLLAGGAIAALVSRFGKRKDPGSDYDSEGYSQHGSHAPSGRPSHRPLGPPGESYVSGEKLSEYDDEPQAKKHTWRNRLLGAGALGGLGYWLSRRKKGNEPAESEYSYDSAYYTESSAGALSRIEEGRPVTPRTPSRRPDSRMQTPNSQDRLTRPLGHRPSHSEMSESSYMSGSPSKLRPKHPVRDGLFGLGALGAAKGLFDWRKRRERKEQKRIEELRRQEAEEEQIQRRKSKKYTGDGPPRRSGRNSRIHSAATSQPGASMAAGSMAAGSMAPSMAGGSILPAPRPSGQTYPPVPGAPPVMTGALPMSSASLLPPPPIHNLGSATGPSVLSRPSTAGGPPQSVGGPQSVIAPQSLGGPQSTIAPQSTVAPPSMGGIHSAGDHSAVDAAAAGLAGAAGGAVLGEAVGNRRGRDNSRVRRSNEASPNTPVSVKLNMHPDGRHVTLRRLTEEEAQKERESKRTRNRSRRERAESAGDTSAMSDAASPDQRWRRQGQGASPSGASRPNYATSSAAGSTAPPPAVYPAVPRPSSNAPPSSAASPAPYQAGAHTPVPMPQPSMGSVSMGQAGMSTASLMPSGSVSTLPGRRPSGAGLLSHPGSVASPGAYDTTTDTQTSQMSNYAENRRRRRAQRAQASAAKAQKGGKDTDFE